MLTQSQLKEKFLRYGFTPLKRLGENYLVDSNIKDKIIKEAALSRNDTVLEIGPGFGALTVDIARSGARVVAVDKDRKSFAILKDMVGDEFPRLELVHGDVLKFDIAGVCGAGRIKVIGNLPYYITTPIIELLIENGRHVSSAIIMVQREVANRLLARPGSKEYGSISCFVQYHTRPAYVFTVKKSSFYPAPDVDSSLIRLDMLKEPSVRADDEDVLFKVIRSSFNQRRKTIMNSLSREAALDMPKPRLEAALREAGIDPMIRPEELSLEDFARIADAIVKQ